MLQNIKNNHTRRLDSKLYFGHYYDFMLYKGEVVKQTLEELSGYTIADFSRFNIIDGILYSLTSWSGATNNGVEMEDIGLTGPDNGFISFERDKISNEDFLKILTESKYDIEEGDTRFFLTPVTGNTQNFDYPMTLEEEDNYEYLSLKGGYYQGFYKLHGFEYQTLPSGPDNEWILSFELRPRSDYEEGIRTLNHVHPENSGMFFYMGTRAENKFWELYKMDSAVTEELKRIATEDDYTNTEECGEKGDVDFNRNNVINEEYLVDEKIEPEHYFEDDYTISASTKDCPCAATVLAEMKDKEINEYTQDDYFADESYVIPRGEKDCKGKRAPGGNLKPFCAEFSTACASNDNGGCSDGSCSVNHDMKPVNMNEYGYNENSCCSNGSCGISSSSHGTKDSCCCGTSDYKSTCKCDDYFQDTYFDEQCYNGPKAFDDEYLIPDAKIDPTKIGDSWGHILTKKGYYEFESDNKFLMFDRTKDGFTTKNWVEGTKVTIEDRKDFEDVNYFLLFNRTETGLTTNKIDDYMETKVKKYNVYNDINNNAFGIRITPEGAIGYRYSIFDCESDRHYKVEEEYSKDGIVKFDEWNKINVKICIINPQDAKCGKFRGGRKMKLYFYVNGFLVFISKELNAFNFKELNDNYQKQEAVPYSISLGGGSQGLLESILPDYYYASKYMLPIEKSYCGTFIGDIKSFKILDGVVNYSAIKDYL